jgi:hypothetical protein
MLVYGNPILDFFDIFEAGYFFGLRIRTRKP